MIDDPRVDRLLEELLDSGSTPEEVCRSCPELLPAVREHWRRARRVLADLSARFAATPDVRVALVSHGSPIGKLILAFAGARTTRHLTVTIDNASISALYEGYGQRYVHAVNRVDHLGSLAAPDVW
jgi:broad specificity phosphatase PhoE